MPQEMPLPPMPPEGAEAPMPPMPPEGGEAGTAGAEAAMIIDEMLATGATGVDIIAGLEAQGYMIEGGAAPAGEEMPLPEEPMPEEMAAEEPPVDDLLAAAQYGMQEDEKKKAAAAAMPF
jgi:hypothetical protein